MQYTSKEEKNAFLSAVQKNLELVFDDGTTIDNEDIALENMNLEQTLCDETELRFGKISAACFKTRISASTKRYKGLWFNATIKAGQYERKLGRFQVHSDEMTSDRIYRDIVAYDALYWAMNTDVTEWYNGLTFPITQKSFRDSLFEYLGVEQEAVELPNDSITFDKTVDAESFTGLKVLEALCEINAVWGVMNSDGLFRYVRMRTQEHDALYPSDDLYPSDNLYPNDIYDETLSRGMYYQGTLKYEEYDVKPISKVVIREDSEDVGYSYGADGNTYVIQGNFLLYGATDETLETIAKNFFDYASYVSYTPSQLSCAGAPWREVGDLLKVIADKRTLSVPILNRRMSGITALKDVYVAKGTETYGENKNSTSEQLKQLQGRTNKLSRNLNETRSELSKVETDLKDNYSTTTETKSLIKQTADEINLEVSKKVGDDEVVSVINQSAEGISLKGNRITIESDNFNLSKEGNVVANSFVSNNANITGGSVNINTNGQSVDIIKLKYDTTSVYCLSQMRASGFQTIGTDGNGVILGGLGILVGKFDSLRNESAIMDEPYVQLYADTNSLFRLGLAVSNGLTTDTLTVTGTKSRIAETDNYNERLLYCYETPTPMFGDIGEGQIDETGKCYIFMDDIFAETIDIDCVYQVFLQPYGKGDCYVTERTSSYFIVEGTKNLSFGWEIKAIQKNFDTMRLEARVEATTEDANVLSETYGYLTTLLYDPEMEVIENE